MGGGGFDPIHFFDIACAGTRAEDPLSHRAFASRAYALPAIRTELLLLIITPGGLAVFRLSSATVASRDPLRNGARRLTGFSSAFFAGVSQSPLLVGCRQYTYTRELKPA